MMADLMTVACAPHMGDKLDASITYWQNMAEDAIPEYARERVVEKDSGTRRVPFDQAAQIMFKQLSIKKGLEHGR